VSLTQLVGQGNVARFYLGAVLPDGRIVLQPALEGGEVGDAPGGDSDHPR
jgi:hypothetical protein